LDFQLLLQDQKPWQFDTSPQLAFMSWGLSSRGFFKLHWKSPCPT
jgi:hypothetical protein